VDLGLCACAVGVAYLWVWKLGRMERKDRMAPLLTCLSGAPCAVDLEHRDLGTADLVLQQLLTKFVVVLDKMREDSISLLPECDPHCGGPHDVSSGRGPGTSSGIDGINGCGRHMQYTKLVRILIPTQLSTLHSL